MHDSLRARRIVGFFATFTGSRWLLGGLTGFESLAVVLLMLAVNLTGPDHASATVQTGFRDVVITSVDAPTDMTFTPGGRLVVTSQAGVLYMLSGGSMISILDLTATTCSDFERGMLGVAFDPLFSSNHYIYVYYTYAKFGGCADNSSQSPVNRVSRFVMSGDSVDPSSEVVLVDNMLSLNGNHNGGDLLFGKDGFLYISVGDSGCELNNASHCGGQNANARKQNYLTGKVLRITRDGGIPAGNPFTGSDSGRCNVNGFTNAAKCQETYLWGLRNPFRMALDPNSASTKIYVNDVGQDTWEEIDEAVAGSDYGWNAREGFCPNGSVSNCTPVSGFRDPVFAYQHSGCNSITGGAFVPNNLWPSTFNGAYLYADYVCGKIISLKNGATTVFGSSLGPITGLQFGPFGPSQALYYSLYSGEIHRIETNRNPVAVATASPKYGLTPLEVTFDGRDSSDPDGDTLSYRWDFKDGSPVAAGSKITHTFQNVGIYNVTLTVTDTQGGSDTTTVTIDAGNTPPDTAITSPAADHLFATGETISLDASATDAQGDLPITYAWDVKLHHDTHEHPFRSFTAKSAQFTAPAPEDLAAATNSYLVLQLTATDSTGLSTTKSINLMPNKVNVTLQANQPNVYLSVEGQIVTVPKTVLTWAGAPLDLEAPDQALASGEPLVWTSWSVPGARAFPYIAPATNSTVTANYSLAPGPSFLPAADARIHESAPNKNEGGSTGLSTSGGTASDYETVMRFTVSGISGTIQSATLYLYAYDGTENGPRIYKTSSNWTETGVTWNNRPASSGGALDDAGAIASRTWFTLDVTGAITGNGTFNLLLRSTSSDLLSFRSRESSSGQPRLVIVTSGGGDTTAPSTPGELQADAPSSSEIDLSWTAATDDTGVNGYEIFRNGALLAFTNQTSFADTGLAPSKTYSYAVRALDAAGNRSNLSNSVSPKTPAQTTTLVFTPSDDAYVDATNPTKNYGARTTLRADSDPATESFLKFTVRGLPGSVYRATLRLFVPSGSGNGTINGPAVRMAGTSWQQSSVTWNIKPAFQGGPVANIGAVGNGIWVNYDVTIVVGSQTATYTFALIGESSDVVVFSSREGANAPQLVVTAFGTSAAAIDEPAGGDQPASSPTSAAGTATPAATVSPTATPALPFHDGFETGDMRAWSRNDGIVVDSSSTRTGSWSARSSADGTLTSPGIASNATLDLGKNERDLYLSSALYLDRVAPNGVHLVTFLADGDRSLLTLTANADGTLVIENGKTGKSLAVGKLPLGEWHTVQLHLNASGNSGTVELWIDGKPVYRGRQTLTNRPVIAIRIGESRLDRAYAVRFDDVAIDRACIGSCLQDLTTPVPTEPAAEPTATNPPVEPTETPDVAPTTPPTETPAPTETPIPADTPTSVPEPTEAPAIDTPTSTEDDPTS